MDRRTRRTVCGSSIHPIRSCQPARIAGRPPNRTALCLCVSVAKHLCGLCVQRSNAHHAEREAHDDRRAPAEASAGRVARGVRAHGDEGRMRRRRVRRVHGAHRWRAGELVSGPRSAGSGRTRDDDRGARWTSSAARGVCRAWGRAVRHLHAGDDHGRRRPRPKPHAPSDSRRLGRKPVPVHGIFGDLPVYREVTHNAKATKLKTLARCRDELPVARSSNRSRWPTR
jgi:hypothetical protein